MFGSLKVAIKIGIPFRLFVLELQFSNLVLRKAILWRSQVPHSGQFSCKLSQVIICRMGAHDFWTSGVPEGGCSATIPLEHELLILDSWFYRKSTLTEGQKGNYSPDRHVKSCRQNQKYIKTHRQKPAIEDTQINLNLDQRGRFGSRRTYPADPGPLRRRQRTMESCRYLIGIHRGTRGRSKSLCTLLLTLCNANP